MPKTIVHVFLFFFLPLARCVSQISIALSKHYGVHIYTRSILRSVAEYESPNIQIELASSLKFLEQIEGALQSLPASFSNSYLLVMSLLTALAYNLDIRTVTCASPT